MIGVLTSHGLVVAHAYKMGLSDREDCREYHEQGTKTAMKHILCTCPPLEKQRVMYLGAHDIRHWKRYIL